ncbi:MAG: zf-HC2 domain-containing protein [Magnetococcus sp. DMHC-6]
MGCNPELVSAFLDGELDKVILKKVTQHLVDCPACRQVMGHLALIKDVIGNRYTIRDAEAFTQSVMAVIQNEKVVPLRERFYQRLLRNGVPMVVAALLASSMAHIDSFLDTDQEQRLEGEGESL